MSRITSDLFDITELLHHGPENITISLIKIIGALCILSSIDLRLTIAAFVLIPFMLVFAYVLNKRMKRAFKRNRVRIGEINAAVLRRRLTISGNEVIIIKYMGAFWEPLLKI